MRVWEEKSCLNLYNYEITTDHRGTIIGSVDAVSLKEASKKIKEMYPFHTGFKVKEVI